MADNTIDVSQIISMITPLITTFITIYMIKELLGIFRALRV